MIAVTLISIYRFRKGKNTQEQHIPEQELEMVGDMTNTIQQWIRDTVVHIPIEPVVFEEESLDSDSVSTVVLDMIISNTNAHRYREDMSFDVVSIDSSVHGPFDEDSITSNRSMVRRLNFDEESLTSNFSPQSVLMLVESSLHPHVPNETICFEEESLTSFQEVRNTPLKMARASTDNTFFADEDYMSDIDWDTSEESKSVTIVLEANVDDEDHVNVRFI